MNPQKDSIALDVSETLPPKKKSRMGRSLIPRVSKPGLDDLDKNIKIYTVLF